MESLSIFIRSIFIDNMIFAYFLGMCSFLAVSKNVKTSLGLGIAVTFVLIVTVPVNYLLDRYVLSEGALSWISPAFSEISLDFLSFILFIGIIAAIVQILEMVIEKYSPALYSSFGIFLPLIAVNCAILGASLFMQERHFTSIGQSISYGFGSGLGWLLAIAGMAAIREKIRYSHIPKSLQGTGIAFIITGLMGIAFMAFLGITI